MKRILMSVVSFICAASMHAQAQCNAAADACAPKKVMGEWVKSVSAGLNLTDGNSNTLLTSAMVDVSKETTDDLYDFGFGFSYGEDDDKGDVTGDSVTRNDVRARAGYNMLLNDRFYVGAGTSFLYDEIADVDYRVGLNPTVGYYLIKNDTYKFALEGGPSYVFEKSGDVKNDYFAPRIANRFDWIISCTSKVFQKAEMLFDADNSDNYLMNAEVGIEAAINSTLSLVLSVRDSYDNDPAAGRKLNDVAVMTALKVAL